jgi:hypothetical protein
MATKRAISMLRDIRQKSVTPNMSVFDLYADNITDFRQVDKKRLPGNLGLKFLVLKGTSTPEVLGLFR